MRVPRFSPTFFFAQFIWFVGFDHRETTDKKKLIMMRSKLMSNSI